MAIPGVTSFGAHIGRAKQGEEVVGVNAAEVWIHIDKSVELRQDGGRRAQRRRRLPGALPRRRDVPQRTHRRGDQRLETGHRGQGLRPGPGPDATRGRRGSGRRSRACPGSSTSTSTSRSTRRRSRSRSTSPRRPEYGLKPGDVRRQAAAMVAGLEMGNVFKDDEVYGVVVWSTPQNARQPHRHRRSSCSTRRPAARVRLGSVASVSMRSDPYLVTRENGSRYIDVGANVQGRDLSSVVQRHPATPQGHPVRRGDRTTSCSASTRSGRPRSAASSPPRSSPPS